MMSGYRIIRIYLILLSFSVFWGTLAAQEEIVLTPKRSDTSLLPLKLTVFARSYFMVTTNHGQLSDYYAWANGLGMKVETGTWKHFQVGARYYGILNTASSDLTAKDPITGAGNRYEIGLFDINNPDKKVVGRLEELYLRYHLKRATITAGRQIVNTPFMNIQDGRMQPTVQNGVWINWKFNSRLKFEGGWIGQISPRSTSAFYPTAKTIGMYGQGVDINGDKSAFYGNLENNGMWIAGMTWKKGELFSIQAWEYFNGQIFNTAFLQAETVIPLKNHKLSLGFQLTRQDDLSHSEDVSESYFAPGASSLIIGGRVGYLWNNWRWHFNYSRITSEGRFLFPREWGREPFYSFIPRERNEGFADVNAYTLSAIYTHPLNKITIWAALGYFKLPDVADHEKNKYGMPSYSQLYLDLTFPLPKLVKGLSARFIYTYKGDQGPLYGNPKYEINKVNLHHVNLMLNYLWNSR